MTMVQTNPPGGMALTFTTRSRFVNPVKVLCRLRKQPMLDLRLHAASIPEWTDRSGTSVLDLRKTVSSYESSWAVSHSSR